MIFYGENLKYDVCMVIVIVVKLIWEGGDIWGEDDRREVLV